MAFNKLMGRVSLCKCLVSKSNHYSTAAAAFPSFNSFKFHSPPFLHFRGWGRKICILADPNPNPLHVKASPTNSVQVGSFDIEAHPTKNAPTANAFHAITGNLLTESKVEETKGLDGDLTMQTAKHTEKMAWLTRIKRGDVINLNDLLFTQNRDYLIRYNDSRQVKAEELADKVIVVYFVPLLADYLPEWVATTHLTDTYNYLLPHNVFEVVLVAYEIREETLCSGSPTNPEKQFEAIFSRMPWTAIPFSDIATRERLSRRFAICMSGYSLDSFVVDSSGMVLQSKCLHLFGKYGGLGYPFSDGRIQLLESEDAAIVEQPSLKMLLASAERDYVISNKGDKVPIDTLGEKVVALLFYEEGKTLNRLIADIELAYEEFAKKKKEFEVVLIYLYDTDVTCGHTNEESFREKFNSMPWLALPFKDPAYRKLKRFFGYNLDLGAWEETPSLVIFGPNGEFIEPWGADILMNYKLPAYPFTREKVAKLEIEKVKELKLEMLFDRNTLFRRNDGTEVPLYELAGKRIILFFEGNKQKDHTAHFLSILKANYPHVERMKGIDFFEVIYVTSSKEDTLYEGLVWDVPWLFALESWLLPIDLSLCCCYCQPPESLHSVLRCSYPPSWCGSNSTLLAFDQDGGLVRKSVYLDFHPITCFDYADTEEDTLSELIKHHRWLDMDREYRGLVINSLYKWYP